MERSWHIKDGWAKAEKDGLYWNVEAETKKSGSMLFLCAYQNGKPVQLGRMIPCGDVLRLQKRISNHAWPCGKETKLFLARKQNEIWKNPTQKPKSRVLLHRCAEAQYLQMPYVAEESFPWVSQIPRLKLTETPTGLVWRCRVKNGPAA